MNLQVPTSTKGEELHPRIRFAAIASVIVAVLVATAALAGLVSPVIYARETFSWRMQAIGQDWGSLVVAVPWLIISAAFVLTGSRRARLLLGGGLAYTTYTYAAYAFDVHFNALFLVYCAALGLSVYALAALLTVLGDAHDWVGERVPRRLAGGFAMALAAAFALLWLSEIVPAIVAGTDPPGLAEENIPTSPAHVLDLALVLPALFGAGWLLWTRRRAGYVLAPVMLGLLFLLGAAMTGMALAMYLTGLTTSLALVIGTSLLAAAAAALLLGVLRPAPGPGRRPPAVKARDLRLRPTG